MTTHDAAPFVIEMKVRDSECDAQGVVNNANYLVYCEHARHEFLEAHGVHFKDLVARQIFLMVAHMDLTFLSPLTGGERFEVASTVQRHGPRARFEHIITRLPERTVCLKAHVDVICKIDGKLTRGTFFEAFG
ncbi:acyl-CoA thioesterase [Asticcacaulis sp. ZE23SCel15]|uniref:acyl-CoA thioesterase n=1 Tax=Asticcacaulis sp. ZE23SCel15 TaxID=3059027 RepID=UPI00265DC5CC|nr:acyl-CoA thioesterase [Asticcacaulis sp. ZE23SCel15]WKL58821.1 acyl-CoA thioesterase [Asticcacaulis sp. ZE23SCel15]